jgi:hypothetical protein
MADWYQNSRDGQLHMVKTWNTVFAISGQTWQVLLINRKKLSLQNAGYKGSINTQKEYREALKRLEQYVERIHINILELFPITADDFIYTLKGDVRTSASIRWEVAAVSSFFTFLNAETQTYTIPS